MNYFLAKTDPATYSIDDLEKDKETIWDGVHSYAAINAIKAMQIGDRVFIYHSQGEAAIVGEAEVISNPRENANDKRYSFVVDIKFLKKLETPISLKQIKESNRFNDWSLVKQSRLSTMSVPKEFIEWIKDLGVKIN